MERDEQQWQRLKERYAQMTEDELAAIAQDASDLTEVAQEALQAVIAERGLDIQLKMEPPAQLRGHPPEDAKLVMLGWPENAEEAGDAMEVLTAAGIPSFLTLEVRESDLKRAHAVLAEDEDDDDNTDDEKDYAILCPKCRSGAVVLDWHCDACGHRWSDEGIGQEVPAGQEEKDSGKEHS